MIHLFFYLSLISYKSDFEAYALRAQLFSVVSGVPASIQLAQAYQENKFGTVGIGDTLNNVFAIMKFDGDYWQGGVSSNGRWRKYPNKFIAWVDYLYYLNLHHSKHIYKPYKHWVLHGKGYGPKGYWKHIGRVIERHDLKKYDLF